MPHLTVEGIELYVHDAGRGAPLVLVHGFPLSHRMWPGQIEFFSKTRRVIAPDLRGFGGSDVVPGTSTMERFADDLAGLLDALGVAEPVHLCGLSMGGMVGQWLGANAPDRVEKLILSNTNFAYADKTPMKRWAQASEMAGPTVFLLSDAASYVTGTILFADGGWLANDGRFTPPGM